MRALLVFIVVLVASFSGCDVYNTTSSSNKNGETLQLNINITSKAGDITPGLFGIHAQGLYDRKLTNSGRILPDTPEGRTLLDSIEFSEARFPAGSGSWGYRLFENDGQTYARGMGYYVNHQPDRYKKATRNNIFDFIEFCNYCHITKATYVANFLQPLDEIQKLIELLSTNNIEVTRVEFGNEYQLKGNEAGKGEPVYRQQMPTVNNYIDWCQRVKDYLDHNGYRGTYAAVCANSLVMNNYTSRPPGNGAKAFYWDWNNAVGNWAKPRDVSIVTHQYLRHGMSVNKDGLSWDQRAKDVVPYLCRDGNEFLQDYIVDYYKNFSGGGANLTEWGVKKSSESFGNTMVEAMHIVRFLLEMNRSNVENGYFIESAFYHKITGQVAASMITRVVDPTRVIEKGNTLFKGETSYYGFRIFHGLIQNATLMNTQLSGNANSLVKNHLLELEVITDVSGRQHIICVNASGNTIQLNISGQNEGIYGTNLLSGNGFNNVNSNGENIRNASVNTDRVDNIRRYKERSGLIRPYSICRITLDE